MAQQQVSATGQQTQTDTAGHHPIDKDAIANYADQHAEKGSLGKCAAYCRRAFEAGGVDTSGHSIDAKDWGPTLLKNGAVVVPQDGYSPQKADVAVFAGNDAHPIGHITVYDGKQWVPSVQRADQRFSSLDNFCPEGAYDLQGVFATMLGRYVDEIDRDFAHERLSKQDAPRTDPAWARGFEAPLHSTSWPTFSDLTGRASSHHNMHHELLDALMALPGADKKYVAQQIERMSSSVSKDPALTIGTAKEVVETCCKTILNALGKGAEMSPKLPSLVKAKEPTNSSASQARLICGVERAKGVHICVVKSHAIIRDSEPEDVFKGNSPAHRLRGIERETRLR